MPLARLVIDLSPLRSSGPFRVLFAVRVVSLFAGGFRLVALPIQVYAMTGSSFLVASVGIVNGVASFGGTLVGGLLADRWDRRRLIVAAAVIEVGVLALFAVNAYLPAPSLGPIYLGAAVNGVAGTAGLIAQQAAVPALVGASRVAAAGALFAVTAQFGAMAAPALGGVAISAWGVGPGYAGTAVIAAGCAVAVAFLPPLRPARGTQRTSAPADVVEGLAFVRRDPLVRPLLVLGFAQVLFTTPLALVPEFTDRVLGGGAALAGLLYTAPAIGALPASLTSGWTSHVRGGGPVVLGAVALCGVAVTALGLSGGAAVAVAALVLLGCGQAIEEILRYALIQRHTPDALRGRVTAAWTAQATVGGSLGATGLGAAAVLLGPAVALVVSGLACVVAAGVIALAEPGLRGRGPG